MKPLRPGVRAKATIQTLERNRTELRLLLPGHSIVGRADAGVAFPRSRTFRWLMGQPMGTWLGGAAILGVLPRRMAGRFLRGLFSPRRAAPAKA